MTRCLEDFVRSEHGALESHHLLGTDEVVTPDLNDLTLKLLERRTVVEKTLIFRALALQLLRIVQIKYSKYLDGSIRLETLPQENLSAEKRFEGGSVKSLALLGQIIGRHIWSVSRPNRDYCAG